MDILGDSLLTISLRVGLAAAAVFATYLYVSRRAKKRTPTLLSHHPIAVVGVVLDAESFHTFPLVKKTEISHNTAM